MSLKKIVQKLLAEAAAPAERKEQRIAWVHETTAALRDAQKEMDDLCMEALDLLDEEEFEALAEMEQEKIDAIMARINAVIEEDKWPRELYWGGI
jgi:hypothetical protein